jgi:hypothetical protein
MTSVAPPPIDQRLQGMAALIRQRIPGAEVRLFGSLAAELRAALTAAAAVEALPRKRRDPIQYMLTGTARLNR